MLQPLADIRQADAAAATTAAEAGAIVGHRQHQLFATVGQAPGDADDYLDRPFFRLDTMLDGVFHQRFFFFNDTATTEIYTLSLHDALPISPAWCGCRPSRRTPGARSDPA